MFSDSCLHLQEHGSNVAERLREALYSVGTPILQSAASTIIGVSFLVLLDSYVYRSFLKTVLLVVVLGAAHGLIILPVLLTMLSCNHGNSAPSPNYTSGGSSTAESEAAPTPPAHRRPVYVLPGPLPVTANSFGLPPYHHHHPHPHNQHHALDELPYAYPTAAVFER